MRKKLSTPAVLAWADYVTAFLEAARSDLAVKKNDYEVCFTILRELVERFPQEVVELSYKQIASRCFLSAGQVRRSVRKLVAQGYLEVIHPSARELQSGGWSLKYQACFERHDLAA